MYTETRNKKNKSWAEQRSLAWSNLISLVDVPPIPPVRIVEAIIHVVAPFRHVVRPAMPANERQLAPGGIVLTTRQRRQRHWIRITQWSKGCSRSVQSGADVVTDESPDPSHYHRNHQLVFHLIPLSLGFAQLDLRPSRLAKEGGQRSVTSSAVARSTDPGFITPRCDKACQLETVAR